MTFTIFHDQKSFAALRILLLCEELAVIDILTPDVFEPRNVTVPHNFVFRMSKSSPFSGLAILAIDFVICYTSVHLSHTLDYNITLGDRGGFLALDILTPSVV